MGVPNVVCPKCGTEFPCNEYDDIFDTVVNRSGMEYIDKCCYTCHVCEEEFTADIHYSLEFSEITY